MQNLRKRAGSLVDNTIGDQGIGNPLTLKVSEIKCLLSTAFRTRDVFDGRRMEVQSLPKESERPRDVQEIKMRSDDDPTDYVIQRMADHDDTEHMSKWERIIYSTSPFWGLLSLVLYWVYFALRVRFTVAAQHSANAVFPLAWTFITVELGVAVPMILHRTWSMLILRGRQRPKLRLIGNSVPSVDVLITCCGEEDSLVYDTAKAACNIDYPTDRFRVIILDDGNSKGLRQLVEHGSKHDFENIYYLARPKFPGVHHHFKA